MKSLFRKALVLIIAAVTFSQLTAATVSTLTSPSSGITVNIDVISQIPYLNIKNTKGTLLAKVRLGLNLSDANYSTGMTLDTITAPVVVTDTYNNLHGKRAVSSCTANSLEAVFNNSKGAPITFEIRAYEDGVTFRYKLPGEEGKKLSFSNELTSYQIPIKAHRWLQAFNTSYEGDFPYQSGGGKTGTWVFPALFELDETFMLITEANIGRNYSATHLDNTANSNQYKVAYPFDYEGYDIGDAKPSYTGTDWVSPWRVMIIGSMGTVVESTLVEDVSDPCKLKNTDFVQPGRASWVYWAYNHGTKDYQICKQYVDLAVKMGWEYVLFDWEWESMGNGGGVKDAVRYALNKKVKPMLWYHSNTSKMQNHNERVKEFAWLKEIGVTGVKIDFFESDKQYTMQYFADILEDAAEYSLLVNFHGCTVPRGWSRTYPHLMSQEAVFGAEQYNNGSTMTTEGARINCLLPYTRNVIGPMDYTPVAFTNSQHPHSTSYAHELALSVAFESGIQHWADRPEGFYALPYEAQLHMKKVPVAWDETKFLDGYPGKAFVVARRKGDTWYVACLNGENSSRQQEISLDFLSTGNHLLTCLADGADEQTFNMTHSIVTAADHITLPCLPMGGFTLIIGQTSYEQYQELKQQASSLLLTAQKNIGTAPGLYKVEMVNALETALSETASVDSNASINDLNKAYATIATALSALQTTGQYAVEYTTGDCIQPNGLGTDVTKTYLRQNKEFTRGDQKDAATGQYYRFGKPKYWTVENYEIDLGADGVKQGIDNYPGYNCLQLGRWEEASSLINASDHANQRLYMQVTLPAGRYYFGASYHSIEPSRMAKKSYIIVANEPLSTDDIESKALAWGRLTTVSQGSSFYGVKFILPEQQTVVLGWQMDGRSQHTEFRCSEVKLLKFPLPTNQIQAPETTEDGDRLPTTYYNLNGQRLSSAPGQGIFVVSHNGKTKKVVSRR